MENLEVLEKLRKLIKENCPTKSKMQAVLLELDSVQLKIRDFKDLKAVDFKTASLPLIKYLNENHHPHVTAIVTTTSCELLEGLQAHIKIYHFLVD